MLVRFEQEEIEAILSALNHLKETGNATSIQLIDAEYKLEAALNLSENERNK